MQNSGQRPRLSLAISLWAIALTTVIASSHPCAADPIPTWDGYGGDPQHTAISGIASLSLSGGVRWSTSVDLNPQPDPGNGDLYIHYGSPLITGANTVIIPVKTGATDGFKVEARSGSNGSLIWQATTDYTLPAHDWTPSYSPVLTPGNRLYYAGAGGTVYYRDHPDLPGVQPSGQIAFYGTSAYTANPTAYAGVSVSTPITTDSSGNIYFGYRVSGANPLGLTDGLARISASGVATYTPASALAPGDPGISTVGMNAAPAISKDGKTLYVAVSNGPGAVSATGDLVAVNAQTLTPIAYVALNDPRGGYGRAMIPDDATASPLIGPDGDVYMGVLESSLGSNNFRGWLLHFSGDLATSKTPGAFGWDDTPSVVPASMVPSYHGTSRYLLMAKYNNYAGAGSGQGLNYIAILDPNDTETDPVTGATVMNEVLKIEGVTPDADARARGYSQAVREWCINSAVVDPATDSILANSEDGNLYRWNLSTNTFTEVANLTNGIGEAYTPTVIGPDGNVYAIQDSVLFAVPEPGMVSLLAGCLMVILARRRRA